MPGSVTLGQPILVNTPFRPIAGREQHAGIVTEVVSVSERISAGHPDITEVTSERITATVFPAEGLSYNVRDIEREDLLVRVGPNAKASSWSPRQEISPGPEPSEQGLDEQAAPHAASTVTGDS